MLYKKKMCGLHVLILNVSPYMAQVSPELFSLNLPNAEITGKY